MPNTQKKLKDAPPTQFTIPLTGKWKPAVDPLNLSEGDLASLENMRYTEGSIQGILGQTKVNTVATPQVTVKSGIQLQRGNPVESEVIIQATDGADSNPKLYVNPTAVPSQGNFTVSPLYTEDASAGIMRGSPAPTGVVAMCDGVSALVYGGNEYSIAKFFDTDPAGSYDYDQTEEVTNSLTTEYATLHSVASAIDSPTMLLLHLDNNVTDVSPATPHTVTNNSVTFSTSSKFGTHSAVFNGSSSYLTVPDNADFDFSGGVWTIDFWMSFSTILAGKTIFFQRTDDSNYIQLYFPDTLTLRLKVVAAGVETVTLDFSRPSSGWRHVAIVENGDNYYAFVDGALSAYASDTDRPANYTQVVSIGASLFAAGAADFYSGLIDEFRISNAARWASSFTPPTAAYGPSKITTVYIGTRMAAVGFKFYVKTANATGTLNIPNYWGAAGWTPVASLSDGTAVAGKSLAQTGTVTFASTAGSVVPKQIGGAYVYWYRFIFSDLDATTAVYQITQKTEVQPIGDLWDGIYRNAIAFYKYSGSTYADQTINVRGRQYYLSTDTSTYFQANGLATTQAIVVGFGERTSGTYFDLDGVYLNTTAGCILNVKYWNGAAWTQLSGISDGTLNGTSSLGTSGSVTWTSPDISLEFTKTINNGVALYYYKFEFASTISVDTRVIGVFGISAPRTMRGYKFPVMWQNRLGLGCETSKTKNTIRLSAANTFNVFNGSDSIDIPIGDDKEITIGGALFNRFGTALTDDLIVCKNTETWVVDGISTANLNVFRVSSTYGCPSPGTFRICDVGYEIAPGINKHIAIWFTGSAVVLFDQNAVLPIHDDILNYFEKWRTEYINLSLVDKFYADYDPVNREYHLFVATGANTTLDTELVFDLKRKRWYNPKRGSKSLSGSFPVIDVNGIIYNYGFDHNGFLYRLEYGQTFDGVSIDCKFRPKDLVFAGIHKRTHIRSLWLLAKSKNTTNNKVVFKHYADTASVQSPSMPTLSMRDTTHRIALLTSGAADRSVGTPPCFVHTLEFSLSTSDEAIGFEPIVIAGEYKVI